MRNWIQFFFGTPRRLVTTLVVIAVLAGFHAMFPGVIHNALVGLGHEILGSVADIISPFTGLIAILLVILLGYKVMFSGLKKKS